MSTVSRGTPLEPWFVTGFLEGEGRFTFQRTGDALAPIFGVKVRAPDRELLERVQAFFGVGSLYVVKARTPANAGAYFRVTNREGLRAIIEHFGAFPLQGGKREAFAVWKEMVDLKVENFRKQPLDRLNKLAGQLSAMSARAPTRVIRSRR